MLVLHTRARFSSLRLAVWVGYRLRLRRAPLPQGDREHYKGTATNSLFQFCSDSNQKREEPTYSTTETDDAPCSIWS